MRGGERGLDVAAGDVHTGSAGGCAHARVRVLQQRLPHSQPVGILGQAAQVRVARQPDAHGHLGVGDEPGRRHFPLAVVVAGIERQRERLGGERPAGALGGGDERAHQLGQTGSGGIRVLAMVPPEAQPVHDLLQRRRGEHGGQSRHRPHVAIGVGRVSRNGRPCLPGGPACQSGAYRVRYCRVVQDVPECAVSGTGVDEVVHHHLGRGGQHRARRRGVGPHARRGGDVGIGGARTPPGQIRHAAHGASTPRTRRAVGRSARRSVT